MDKPMSLRTEGDGVENTSVASVAEVIKTVTITQDKKNINLDNLGRDFLNKQSHTSLLYNPSAEANINFPLPVEPKGKKFYLIPKLHQTKATTMLKNKSPKFLPFEPYKAAVNPIIPFKNNENKVKISSRNNLDLNVLVKQLEASTADMRERKTSQSSIMSEFDHEKQKYDQKLVDLKKERDYFENQLKFQVQVNTELKNLLVAAVGEDVQSRVNVLTEDKLQMAEHLSTHTEKIEFLAGQSEVWRSKFLASSLMVEELARWKASLTQKNNLLQSSNKHFLELTAKVREMQIEILQNIKFLSNNKDLTLKSSNVMDLTAEMVNISQQMVLQSGKIGMPAALQLQSLDPSTNAEKLALEALQNLHQPLMSTDEAFKAIVGQAFPTINAMKNDRERELEKDYVVIGNTETSELGKK
ncbi:unnamed protein product [Diamesa serratosioi]